MKTEPKTRKSRSQEIAKTTDTKPFADNLTVYKFRIAHIMRGFKHIRSSGICRSFPCGSTICMAIGIFDIENVPDETGIYEETVIEYSASELQKIITQLQLINGITIDGSANRYGFKRFCGCRMENAVASLFAEIERDTDSGKMTDEHIASLKSRLIYLLTTYADNDTVNCMLENLDSNLELLVRTVYEHVFVNCTIEEIAAKCNRSLSVFKDDFYRIFMDTPHHWIMVQRMNRARFLLLNTDKSIQEIGYECLYANPSHFTKNFRKIYNTTPAKFRKTMRNKTAVESEMR